VREPLQEWRAITGALAQAAPDEFAADAGRRIAYGVRVGGPRGGPLKTFEHVVGDVAAVQRTCGPAQLRCGWSG